MSNREQNNNEERVNNSGLSSNEERVNNSGFSSNEERVNNSGLSSNEEQKPSCEDASEETRYLVKKVQSIEDNLRYHIKRTDDLQDMVTTVWKAYQQGVGIAKLLGGVAVVVGIFRGLLAFGII